MFGEGLVNDHNFALRPEAGPVPPTWLTESQKTVLQKVVTALNEAQKLASANEVDPEQVSRLFFVSGEPGSGKTTLYLTLRDALNGEHIVT